MVNSLPKAPLNLNVLPPKSLSSSVQFQGKATKKNSSNLVPATNDQVQLKRTAAPQFAGNSGRAVKNQEANHGFLGRVAKGSAGAVVGGVVGAAATALVLPITGVAGFLFHPLWLISLASLAFAPLGIAVGAYVGGKK